MTRMEYQYFVDNILNNDCFAFYFDTNTLLGLYKKPEKVINNYSSNLQSISNLIKIPSVVHEEYKKNEHKKRNESKSELQNLIRTKILRGLQQIDESELSKLDTRLRNNETTFDSDEFNTLKQELIRKQRVIISFIENLDIQVNDNKNRLVSDFIENFMFDIRRILPKLSRLEKNRYMNEGYTRVKHHLPPGYMDVKDKYHKLKQTASKDGRTPLLKPDNLADYLGDYFIWSEILKDAKTSDKDALFITSDLKEDWWHIPSDESDLAAYRPRVELVEEFEEITNKKLQFIPFDLFIRYLEIYNNQGLVANYLSQNFEMLSLIVKNYFPTREIQVKIETDIAYDEIVYDSDLTKGYVPYDWFIECDDVQIESIDSIKVISYDEDLDDGGIKLELNVSVSWLGNFFLRSGLEDEIYRSVDGNFSIEGMVVHIEIKLPAYVVEQTRENLDSYIEINDLNGVVLLDYYIEDSGNIIKSYNDL